MTDPLEPNEPIEPVEPLQPIAPPPPRPAPTAPKGPYKPSPFPGILTGLALGAVLVGAGFLLAQTLPKKEEAPAPAPTAASSPAPSPAPETEAKPDPVAALTARVDDLQKQLAAMPKPEPAPDVKPIEAKVDALAKRLDTGAGGDTKAIEDKVGQVSATLADSQSKLDALTKSVDAQKGDLAALRDQVKSLSEAKPAPAAAAATADSPAPAANANANANAEADYTKAVDLFKKNQFGPAREAFTKLQESMPNDARVWYYSALSTGYATNDWNGEAVRLVTKGKELEKAGQPDAAKVNAALADLPAGTKNWVDAYRK